MRVYISGAITADKGYYRKFLNAEIELKKKGFEVVNPARVAKSLPKALEYEDYMRIDWALIEVCDSICLLKDWETSAGSKREKEYAEQLGKKIIYQKEKRNE